MNKYHTVITQWAFSCVTVRCWNDKHLEVIWKRILNLHPWFTVPLAIQSASVDQNSARHHGADWKETWSKPSPEGVTVWFKGKSQLMKTCRGVWFSVLDHWQEDFTWRCMGPLVTLSHWHQPYASAGHVLPHMCKPPTSREVGATTIPILQTEKQCR